MIEGQATKEDSKASGAEATIRSVTGEVSATKQRRGPNGWGRESPSKT